MRLFLYRSGRLKVALGSGGVESIFVEAPDTTSTDSVRAGAPGIAALDRWGDPARLDRETGAAVWVGSGWELHAYLASDGQSLHALELRRPRALPRAP